MKEKANFSKKKAMISIVCVIVAIIVATGLIFTLSQNTKKPAPASTKLDITTFESYDEIYKIVDKMELSDSRLMIKDGLVESNIKTYTSSLSVSGDIEHGNTYNQVDDVEEGDILKTNGKAIFYADSSDGVHIYAINKGEAEEKTTITNDQEELADIYLNDNMLVTITNSYAKNTTITTTYDVRDVDHIKRINKYIQSGAYRSSRMIDDDLFVLSSQNIANKKDIPFYAVNDEKTSNLAPSDISCVALPSTPSYLVITKIDTKSKNAKTETKAILGASSDVYCNEDNMYVTGPIINLAKPKKTDSNEPKTIDDIHQEAMLKEQTEIIKIDISDSIKFVATAKLNGRLNNQYSMDEKDGKLRIALTSIDDSNSPINKLYVLDESLKEIGSTAEFAPNESIKAVRYIKNTAYVITYEETDPLFVIDLSNSKKPNILGECTIDGFSSMLVPAGENKLLGIGFNTKNDTGMQVTDGLKLVLFDISDSTKPKVIDEKVMEGYDSSVQFDARALIYNKSKDVYHIPFNHGNNDKGFYTNECGTLTFGVKGDKISTPIEQKLNDKMPDAMCERCTYADEYLYSITNDGKIYSNKMK